MPIRLYNTLNRKKQTFKSLDKKIVKIYTCGPTVYDIAHIGNLRTYIFEDVLRRVLEYNNYKVKQVMNITDVEDKIINKAVRENKTIGEIIKPYEKIFFDDIKKLNIKKAEVYPRATKHIKEMISLIKKIIKKKIAYKSDDGSVYFEISKFRNYGRLSELEKRKLKTGARISADEYQKENAKDFVLWKAKKDDEPSWPSPWGNGRPGWHIECSAMSIKYLGEHFDIHAGGVDNIFPHHENEIAQAEAATEKKFVNFWLHGEHLLVEGEKMSKSLGNIYTLRDLEKKSFNPLALRYLILTSHYCSKLNFTWAALEAAQNTLNYLYQAYLTLDKDNKINGTNKSYWPYTKRFRAAINNDLNTPKALAILWRAIKDKNLPASLKKRLLLEFDSIFGLGLKNIKKTKIPLNIKAMAAERVKLRNNQQFVQSDLLRKKIERLGYIVEDTLSGPKIRKK
ncbi:MAG: cysteine--tRNA ligase [Patescibacteria group bacterium]